MSHPSRAARIAAGGFLTFALAACTGCGESGTGVVKGKVTVGNQALPSGLITFLSEAGKKDSYSAAVINGEYTTGEIPVGPTRVIVIPSLQPAGGEPAAGGDVTPVPRATGKPKGPQVPEKYQNPETSGLQWTVKRGENVYDVKLEP